MELYFIFPFFIGTHKLTSFVLSNLDRSIIAFIKYKFNVHNKKEIRNEGDSVAVGIGGNVYNWLSFGIVGNSVCRTWESCPLAFPCPVNRVIHDSIASYAHFHNAPLLFRLLMFRRGGYAVFSASCFFLWYASLLDAR